MEIKTIFALSTAPGKAGLAVVRLSGNESFQVIKRLSGSVPPPRKAVLRKLIYDSEFIDQAIVICFSAKQSYTGEDMVEFHIHGSSAVLRNLTEVLVSNFGLIAAAPGEFTRRALENEKMDLLQVEGLLDLINSETKQQKKQALRSLTGKNSNKSNKWREKLVSALAYIELMIDFTEEDVPSDTIKEISDIVLWLSDVLETELQSYKSSELIRDGYDVTIIGKPNVGKSSLLNYLAGKEKAIVSEHAGTTRDIIELSIDLQGYQVNFFDTAGIHRTDDLIEQIGITRAIEKASSSHVRIFLLENNDLEDSLQVKARPNDIICGAKSDIWQHPNRLNISAKTGEGVEKLLEEIRKRITQETQLTSILINERHKDIIKCALSYLNITKRELKRNNLQIEIVAENLRLATVQLDLLIGKINVEDVLGSIFASFCIGK